MFKRGMFVLVCLTAMTSAWAWAATSFQLQTKITNAGGQLQVDTKPIQSAPGSLVFANFTSDNVNVNVTANTGYAILSISKNGVAIPGFVTQTTPTFVGADKTTYNTTFSKSDRTVQALVVKFYQSAATKLTISTPQSAGGKIYAALINPLPTWYKVLPGSAGALTIAPDLSTGKVVSVTAPGWTVADLNGNTSINYPYQGVLKATIAHITADGTVSATFSVAPVLTGLTAAQQAAYATCSCHTSQGQSPVFAPWAASKHAAATPVNTCSTCHVGMKIPANATALCSGCHKSLNAAVFSGWSGSKHSTNTVGCISCHNSHSLAVGGGDVSAACTGCHGVDSGIPAIQANNWKVSSHNINTNGFEQVGCNSCHNPHTTVATLTDGKTDSCAACHLDKRGQFPGAGNYSIYTSASMLVLKAPHGGGKATSAAAGDGTTQYLTQGAICSDCHGHNNAINTGFAEGGHGKVSSDPLNAFAHYDWNTRTNNGTRQNGNCDRCHTAYGFIKFANQTTGLTRLQLKTGQANNVLICIGCHKTAEGELRTDAVPAGNGGPLSGGYFALFSSASATAAGKQGEVAVGKTKIQIAFPGYKNSSICVPCHSGRSTADVFTAVIDQANTVNKNYSTVQTSYYQHAANMGQTFIGTGGYDFTGNLAKVAANGHANVKNGANDDKGPCVGCHYSTLTKTGINNATHSLEVNADSPDCRTCHNSGFGASNVAAAKANYDAGVAILDTLIRAKFAPLQTKVQGVALEEERANVRFGRFGKAAGVAADATTAKKAYGAWYNWQILTVYDKAAFAHNPAYARQLLNDTGDYLLNPTGAYGGQSFNAYITAQQVGGFITTTTAANALAATKDLGCSGCHSSALDPYAGNLIVATYNASGHSNNGHGPNCATCHAPSQSVVHPTGATPEASMLKGYVAAGQACINCHNGVYSRVFGTAAHFTNATSASFHNVSAAYVGYKGKGINVCATCHFTFDPHGIGAGTVGEATFTTNAPILAAWAESGHGDRSGAAWIPGASHDWRNSGSTVNFSTTIPASDCVRCHTSAGFKQFVDSGFTNVSKVGAADGQRFNSPLACNACHATDAVSGSTIATRRSVVVTPALAYGNGKTYTSYPAPVANVGVGVATFYNISTVDKVSKTTVKARIAVNFPDVGESNMCNSCHSARLGGSALVAAVNNGLSLSNSSFQNSHYMGAAGTMYAKAGFTAFTSASAVIGASTYGKSLTSSLDMNGGVSSTHRNLGTPAIVGDHSITAGTLDSGGPCVTCHMQAKDPLNPALRNAAGHSLAIAADAYGQLCVKCHTTEGSATGPVALTASNFVANFIEPNQSAFQVSLKLATTLLRNNYGIKYDSANYPYFYDMTKDATGKTSVTDWTRGGTLSNAAALKLEGACLNINLLSREPAAFVHARSYTRRLIYDSIDFLDDGVINMSVSATAHTVDPANFTAGTTAYTDGTLGTFTSGTTEGMLYLKGWNRTTGAWNPAPERP